MVLLPQELVPNSSDTTIVGEPSLSRRLYGPAQPSASPPGPALLYTVPEGKRVTLTEIVAANVDISSPPVDGTFTLSLGADAVDTRLFSDVAVEYGKPFAQALAVTLEAGEFLEGSQTNVTLCINGIVTDA